MTHGISKCLHLNARTVLLQYLLWASYYQQHLGLIKMQSLQSHPKLCKIKFRKWSPGFCAGIYCSSYCSLFYQVSYVNILPPINPDSSLSLGGISCKSWVSSIQDVPFWFFVFSLLLF